MLFVLFPTTFLACWDFVSKISMKQAIIIKYSSPRSDQIPRLKLISFANIILQTRSLNPETKGNR